MSNTYGDGGFYFLKPVGAGPGYPGSGSGYGELAFDGQVYTDGKDYPMQGALRRGYGEDSDYSGPNDYRILMTPSGPERVLDWSRIALTAANYRLVQGLYAYWSNKANDSKRLLLSRLPFGFSREGAEKEYKKRQILRDYFAQGLRRWSAPQPQRSAPPPVVRQGFYPSQQSIPSDLREALNRAVARRAQARTQAELRALQAEIARLQQLMMAQQVASVQQTAPAVTQYAPSPTVSAAPETSYIPEDAVMAMPEAADVKEKQIVGLDAAEGAAAEEPSFIEKYGLFLGIAAVAAGGYYYMNRKEQAAV